MSEKKPNVLTKIKDFFVDCKNELKKILKLVFILLVSSLSSYLINKPSRIGEGITSQCIGILIHY